MQRGKSVQPELPAGCIVHGTCCKPAGWHPYHKFDKKYNELIEQARKENPLPETTEKKRGRKKKGKILALVERLANYKASVCLFINNFNVPFDNNQAERDLRMIKVKTKVSGCFRTEEGARDYLKIMSYVGTAHKQGYNAYKAIKQSQVTLISSLNKGGFE